MVFGKKPGWYAKNFAWLARASGCPLDPNLGFQEKLWLGVASKDSKGIQKWWLDAVLTTYSPHFFSVSKGPFEGKKLVSRIAEEADSALHRKRFGFFRESLEHLNIETHLQRCCNRLQLILLLRETTWNQWLFVGIYYTCLSIVEFSSAFCPMPDLRKIELGKGQSSTDLRSWLLRELASIRTHVV